MENSNVNTDLFGGGQVPKPKRVTALAFLGREHPELERWYILAVEWIKAEPTSIKAKQGALTRFFKRYVLEYGLPLDPAAFLSRKTDLPDFFDKACPNSKAGVVINDHIFAFLNFVLLHKFSSIRDGGFPVISLAYRNPVTYRSSDPKIPGVTRDYGKVLGRIARNNPQLATWVTLAAEWMKGETGCINSKLNALSTFFKQYLAKNDLFHPAALLARSTVLPGRPLLAPSYNNFIHSFLNFVLLREFSIIGHDGQPAISPATPVQDKVSKKMIR